MDGGTRGQRKLSSGVLVCFSLFLLLVAPFHYAIDRCIYSLCEGRDTLRREFSQGTHWEYFSLTAALSPQGKGGADEWSATDRGTVGLIVQ